MSAAWSKKEKAKALGKGCTCHYGEDATCRWFIASMTCPVHRGAEKDGDIR